MNHNSKIQKSKMKNLIEDILQERSILIGSTYEEVKWYLGKEPDIINGEKWVYFVEKYFFGILTRKLHLYFRNGKVNDFYVG